MLIDSEINRRAEGVAVLAEHKEVAFVAEEIEQGDKPIVTGIVCVVIA